jgi:hypothetical protein
MDRALLSKLGHVVPYAQDDPVLPPVGTPADVLPSTGPNLKAWLYWMSDVLDKEPDGRRERVLRDPYPLPDVVNREGYSSDDHLAFWMSGYADYLKTVETLAPYGCTAGGSTSSAGERAGCFATSPPRATPGRSGLATSG